MSTEKENQHRLCFELCFVAVKVEKIRQVGIFL